MYKISISGNVFKLETPDGSLHRALAKNVLIDRTSNQSEIIYISGVKGWDEKSPIKISQLVNENDISFTSESLFGWADAELGKSSAGGAASSTIKDFNPALNFSNPYFFPEFTPTGDLDITLANGTPGGTIIGKVNLDGAQLINLPEGSLVVGFDYELDQPLAAGIYYLYFLYDGANIRLSIPSTQVVSNVSEGVQTLVFREPFYAVGANSAALSTINWNSNVNSGAVSNAGRLRDYVGLGSIVPVNAGYTDESDVGVTYDTLSGVSRDRSLIWTEKYTISRTGVELDRFAFSICHFSTPIRSAFAVKVGSQWYVYNEFIQMTTGVNSGADFATGGETLDVVLDMTDTTKWLALDFVSGSSLSIGSAIGTVLPAGNVTAFGIYSDRPTAASEDWRFDTLEIYTK